ncbi:Oxygen-regulated invasion protein OrgB [Pseudomonas fluorescens]|uniref:Oxygen-regulated invasion protein OrgB n=1 Tax=Pseudomonas fluorescens TaxID=294 RepID=A0A5E7AKM8_PSEFL|nr:oxygen-regulated invasion protein OrgB [Pseudomonas fluorescens]VVN76371.1 Oxygen-regulated invasion protein OrgB [Pseudomonas fluorescens]
MLDAIRTLTELPDSHSVHLSREDISATRQRRTLERQAQRWARECVDQARHDAEAVHAEAFQRGYAEGILRASEHLAEGLLESQALGQKLRQELAQAARGLLAEALSRPEWLDEMLERWLATQSVDSVAVLHVLLPLHCQSRSDELHERLNRLWPGEVIVDYHPQERYVVRLADQLLEFDTETSRRRLEPRLLACVENLPESVRALDQSAIQALTALCSSFTERNAGFTPAARPEVSHED